MPALDDPDDDLIVCPDCGSTEIISSEDMIRPYRTEFECLDCGNLRCRLG